MEHRPRRRLRVPRVTVDPSALRASRELRWLVMGNVVSGLGTQAALVALPYQVYIQTRSALLTGLLAPSNSGRSSRWRCSAGRSRTGWTAAGCC